MSNFLKKLYTFIETLPDRLYPFACEIEGKWVRGQQSYKNAMDQAFETYGPHRLGLRLTIYRGVFHFVGSILFIIFAALLSRELFGSEVALYVLMAAAIIALALQEFHTHPKRFKQPRIKGIFDWLTWIVPMVAYVLLINF